MHVLFPITAYESIYGLLLSSNSDPILLQGIYYCSQTNKPFVFISKQLFYFHTGEKSSYISTG